MAYLRELARQEGSLNLTCRFKFSMHGDELSFFAKHAADDAVTQTDDECEDADRFDADGRHHGPS